MRNAKRPKPEAGTGDEKLSVMSDPWSGVFDKPQLLRLIPWSPGTLSNRMRDGSIPFIKMGSRVLFDGPSVRAALLRQQRGGPGQ